MERPLLEQALGRLEDGALAVVAGGPAMRRPLAVRVWVDAGEEAMARTIQMSTVINVTLTAIDKVLIMSRVDPSTDGGADVSTSTPPHPRQPRRTARSRAARRARRRADRRRRPVRHRRGLPSPAPTAPARPSRSSRRATRSAAPGTCSAIPGIRSDSDMFTLGYSFRPWEDAKAIADGPSILGYIRETARDHGVDGQDPLQPPRRARRVVDRATRAGRWRPSAPTPARRCA